MVWAVPRSLATTYGITIVFSSCGYLDVSVLRVRPPKGVLVLQTSGLPHSDTLGSSPASGSPKRFVACHVLHRHQKPEASPSRPFAACLARFTKKLNVLSSLCVSTCIHIHVFVSPCRSKNSVPPSEEDSPVSNKRQHNSTRR